MDSLWQDIRYAARSLKARPLFAALAVAIVAIGVGANVAVFDLAHALFLRSLPVPNAERLTTVHETRQGAGYYPMSYANYLDYRAQSRVFEELASHYSGAPIRVTSGDRVEVLDGSVVSDNFFSMLEVEPHRGRLFLPDENRTPGTHPVTVLSYDMWQDWFGGGSEVIGSELDLNGFSFVVVGVAPQSFRGLHSGQPVDFWIPSMMSAVGYRWCDTFSRGCTYLRVLGRLEQGATVEQAGVELDLISQQLEEAYPDVNEGTGATVVAALGVGPGNQSGVLLTRLLGAIVTMVLLVACANLAGLLLARNGGRQREIAVRASLGAGRSRIVQQLLIEALVIALLGGGAGLLVALWTRAALVSFLPYDAAWLSAGIDGPVLLFTLGLSAVVSLVFGLWPALEASRVEVASAIKQGAARGQRASRLRSGLVVAQVAASLALLVTTSLLTTSLANAIGDPLASDNVLTLRVRPNLLGYDVERSRSFHHQVLERLESLPGVTAAGMAQGLPHWRYGPELDVSTSAGSMTEAVRISAVSNDAVTPGFFSAVGLALVRGRDFTARDRLGATPVVTVNRTLALRLWGDRDPIGERLVVGDTEHTVAGVVTDAHRSRTTEPPVPYFYRPWAQLEDPMIDSRLCVRFEGDATSFTRLVLREIATIDPQVPVVDLSTLRSEIEDSYRSLGLAAKVTGSSGVIALLLTAIGLYGLLALSVGQRNKEIGVRVAVGAKPGDLVRIVVGAGLRWTLLGLALGVPLALAASRLLSSFLYGVTLLDPGIYVVAAGLLCLTALLASYVPARRAATIDPILALRSE